MADWALTSATRFEANIATSSRGTAGAKGSYVQVVASTAIAYQGLVLGISQYYGGVNSTLADLSIGAAGSESVVVPNILIDTGNGSSYGFSCYVPIQIPSGSRIAVRHQETGGSGTRDLYWSVTGIGAGSSQVPALSAIGTAYNVDVPNTTSTNAATPSASANTWGAWAEVTSATSAVHKALVVCIGCAKNTTQLNGRYRVQIGVGSAGSEVGLYEFAFRTSSNIALPPLHYSLPCEIPSGTRIAFRVQCDAANGTARSCVVIGF